MFLANTSLEGIAVKRLGIGCACCTLAFLFEPLLARFIRHTKPDRLILKPAGVNPLSASQPEE
jgi:G3E family GTPase